MSSVSSLEVKGPLEDIHVNEPKYDEVHYTKLNDHDLQIQLAELDEQGAKAMRERTWYGRLLNLEYELNFKNKKHMVVMLGFFASFAGILSGLDQSIISGAIMRMSQTLSLDPHQQSLVSSLMPLGAMAGSMLMVPLNYQFGRRGSLILSCLWYTLGAGLCAGARSVHMMYAGRFIVGVGLGIEGGCVGIYISESVPATVRGNLVSMYQFNIALGEVVGYAIGAIFYDVKGGWRYMLGSSLVFSTILLVGLFFLPESPRWLVSKSQVGEAWLVWKRLRDIREPTSKMEFLEMRHVIVREREGTQSVAVWRRYFDLIRIARNRRALTYTVIMVFLGQMTGINGVMYNMASLMHNAVGFDDRDSVLMSMVGGGSLLVGAIPAILWMDRFGRRVWAQNIVAFLVGLVLVGIGSRINKDTHRSAALGVSLTGIILYMGFFGTYACLTWVLPAESFDLRSRSQGMAVCSVTLYLFSFIITYNFEQMQEKMTYIGLMIGFFGGLAALGFVYQLIFMPETKDKTLEEIDDIFSMPTYKLAQKNLENLGHGMGSCCTRRSRR